MDFTSSLINIFQGCNEKLAAVVLEKRGGDDELLVYTPHVFCVTNTTALEDPNRIINKYSVDIEQMYGKLGSPISPWKFETAGDGPRYTAIEYSVWVGK